MTETLLESLAVAGGEKIFLAAGENLVKKLKTNHDIKALFIDTGEFFANYENNSEQLFQDIQLVLSDENMVKIANECKADSGYTLKRRLLSSLVSLMDKYDIPRDHAMLYANNILYTILSQLPEIAPEKYDRYFQSEWREEQKNTLEEIKQKIEKVCSEIALYNSKSIDISSADELDIRIRKQTYNSKIGIEFFNIDDDNFKELFADQKENEIIRVRAKCREEAIYCIINELWNNDEKRAVFVVNTLEAWEKLSKLPSTGNIYIPWFWAEEICAINGNTNIFIFTDDVPSFSHDEIVLRRRTLRTITNALVNAGMGIEEATNLVNETHGLYIPMKKKIFNGQYLKKPEWIEKLSDNIKKAALLMGQWTDLDGDQIVVSSLSGMTYDGFIGTIMPFTKGEDPFIHVVNSNGGRSFYLASVENSWEYLDIDFADGIWGIFKNLFIEVLNESEKLFTYSTQDRMLAQFKGEHLFWSSVLRSGMIRSLIMKAFYKNDRRFQGSLDDLIGKLLENVQTVEKWKYISNFFVDLCELSPKAVLDKLFSEYTKPTGLLTLFDVRNSDLTFEKSHYVDILFGVDEFLVQDEYASRGFEWLLRLDDKSYDFRGNSPQNSIYKVLCTWCNFSAFRSVDEKIKAAERALELDRNAWDYVYEALPTNSRSVFGDLCKPKYRPHVEIEAVTYQEIYQMVEKYVLLLIEKIDFIPDRCGKLLRISEELPDKLSHKIFDAILYQANQMSAPEQADLKMQIRQIIYRHRYFASASWAMGEDKIRKYEKLLNEIHISVPEYEYVYLFNYIGNEILLNPIPHDKDVKLDLNYKKAQETRGLKIAEFKRKGLDLSILASACSLCKMSNLGRMWALYGSESSFEQNVFVIFYNSQESKELALNYCQEMFLKDHRVFEKVISQKDELKFPDSFIVGLYRMQALNTEDIPLIESATESIKALFWKNDLFLTKNYEWALKECKKYGTINAFIMLLFRATKECKYDNETLYNYMVDIYKLPYDDQVGGIQYYISELMDPLQKEYLTIPERAQKLVEIEIHFYALLGWERMKCFQHEITRTPEVFAEIVSFIYKKDDNTEKKEEQKKQKELISLLYRLYYDAHFCPAEKNGTVDGTELENWLQEFRRLLQKNHQERLFGFLIGRLLAFSPPGKDGYYPCEAVREAIEKYADDSLMAEYKATLFNERGIFSPSEGRDERDIAKKYKTTAERYKINYPKTAEIYYDMYRRYMFEAEEERNRAENGRF